MRTSDGAWLLLLCLAGCSAGESSAKAADDAIDCAVHGAARFAHVCAVERGEGPDARLLIVRHPDGGFRRFERIGPAGLVSWPAVCIVGDREGKSDVAKPNSRSGRIGAERRDAVDAARRTRAPFHAIHTATPDADGDFPNSCPAGAGGLGFIRA